MAKRSLVAGGLALMAAMSVPGAAQSAEFGASPWLKGYTDIFGGVIPSVPGFYFRADAYTYSGSAGATIFNGLVNLGVDQDFTATVASLTYVTPWKPLGGTFAVNVTPTVVTMDVGLGLGIPTFTGPRGNTFGGFTVNRGDTNLDLGDTVFAPAILGWDEGNFHWNVAMFVLAPTGDYSTRQLANTSLNHWSFMPRFAATYFDPQTGWQATGAVLYTWNTENTATNYTTGDLVNFEGSITKNFGPLGLGVVGYGMVQVTGDSGAGARLGSFESEIYGLGPIATFTTSADPTKALTVILKYYKEFDAKNAFEGETFDAAISFKF
ncbi:hypothetical protein AUC68_00185 [Methyloceanibacter methanicus]|uniref:Phenol degradation protein meta n=1 Tax=Methyloceanibacter methanicus TaxID=1774968 RepID=A0A1E3W667_9HYPH|nr:transporter [Methyloceanibacter methanicus]ODS01328.1 hypothetical protein AUC68_00185 [Methyloceanibacter methanicus]